MSDPKSNLYQVAIGNFKLKDRIVRRLSKDLRRYKKIARAAGGLLLIGGGG